ncbi:hypothetical protein Tco_0787169, partial [Tanacetum coccineum]
MGSGNYSISDTGGVRMQKRGKEVNSGTARTCKDTRQRQPNRA